MLLSGIAVASFGATVSELLLDFSPTPQKAKVRIKRMIDTVAAINMFRLAGLFGPVEEGLSLVGTLRLPSLSV